VPFVVGLERPRDVGGRLVQETAAERGVVGSDRKVLAGQALVEEIDIGL
jgi:hypothetical protein